MIDFNPTDEAPERLDLQDVRERLSGSAPAWVPYYFSQGRVSSDRSVVRCGDLTGRAPTKDGSCVINLTGPRAGYGHDFATGESAGPIDLIGYATGLSGRELFDEAARVARVDLPKPAAPAAKVKKDYSLEIQRIREKCLLLPGTVGETYLRGRGLELPQSDDVGFNPALNDYKNGIAYPGLVAVIRDHEGNLMPGVHRTFLLEDGSGKAPPGKKMLGAVNGGAVRLAAIGPDGHIGIAEGIETALAVTKIFNVPCWATLSREHMIAWRCAVGVQRVTIFADGGVPGEKAADALCERLKGEGIAVEIKVPMHGDDFNDDLNQGMRADHYAADVNKRHASGQELLKLEDIEKAAWALKRPLDPVIVSGLLKALVSARPSPVEENLILHTIKTTTGVPMGVLRKEVEGLQARLKATGDVNRDAVKPPWFGQLQLGAFGEAERNELNVITAIRSDEAFAGVIVYDDFRQEVMITKPLPWERQHDVLPRTWRENDNTELAVWMQARKINVSTTTANRAAMAICRDITVHPVREFLNGLQWDGFPRIETWVINYLGAEDVPINRAFGALWMISAVARIMKPGCKADHMLILEGPQGIKKSTALKTLAGEDWFTDQIAELGSKDSSLQMQGVWIIEIAELDAMQRGEVSKIKAFMASTSDRFRPPYERQNVDLPRQCIFAGSVNHDGYLRDETGGRRFWPVKCTSIDLDALRRDREQLWAEAMARYSAGAIWWLDDAELIEAAKQAQGDRREVDDWESEIDEWIQKDGVIRRYEPLTDISIGEVLESCMGIERGKWTNADQKRVARILKASGWTLHVPTINGKRVKRYKRTLH